MEVNIPRSGSEAAHLAAAALQDARFNERRLREAQSDVRNQVVYFSPVIRIDSETNTAILQYRDSTTGEVKNQFPSQRQVDVYRQAEAKDVEAPADEKPAHQEDEIV